MVKVVALSGETRVDAKLPDFSTMTEEQIRAYAEAEGKAAYERQEEHERTAEFLIGSHSPINASRAVTARILKAAGHLTEEQFEKATQPVHVSRGIRSLS